MVPGNGYVRGFDGIRALAVAFVIAVHLGAFTSAAMAPYRFVFDGVMVFFVLSGFLITGILMKDTRRSLPIFFAKRMLRLYPALVLYLGAVLLFDRLGWADVPSGALLAGLFYFVNYVDYSRIARETSHLWSLGVEEQFYLLWPLVMFFARRLAVVIAIAVVAASWVLRIWPPDHPNRYVDRYFIPAADAILIGCIAALLVCGTQSPLVQRMVRSNVVGACGLVLMLAPRIAHSSRSGPVLDASLAELQRVGVALILIWICGHQTSRLVNALEWSPLRYLGRISYGIYLWQGLFVRNGPTDPRVAVHHFPLNVLCAVLAAMVSFELVEQRFLRMKDRLNAPPATPASPVVSAAGDHR